MKKKRCFFIIVSLIIILAGCASKSNRLFEEKKEINFKSRIIEDSQSYEIVNYETIAELTLNYEELLINNNIKIDGIKFVNRGYMNLGSTKDVDIVLENGNIVRMIFNSNQNLIKMEIEYDDLNNNLEVLSNFKYFSFTEDEKSSVKKLSSTKYVSINDFSFYLSDIIVVTDNRYYSNK